MEEYKTPVQLSDQLISQYLNTLANNQGKTSWEKIAKDITIKFTWKRWSVQDCKDRWRRTIDQSVLKHPWTEQELDMLIGYRKYQDKWSSILQALNKRDNNTIKNRFYSILRKIINKIKRRDLICNSKLELLECLFMIFLIEQCYENPLTPTEEREELSIFAIEVCEARRN